VEQIQGIFAELTHQELDKLKETEKHLNSQLEEENEEIYLLAFKKEKNKH